MLPGRPVPDNRFSPVGGRVEGRVGGRAPVSGRAPGVQPVAVLRLSGMRKIIESTLVSLDGVVESPWAWADFDDEAKAWALENLRGYDGFLLGRGTFEPLRAAWEHVRGDPYLDAVNAARKYVVSDTLPADPGWNAEVLRGGAAALADLRRRPGRPLVKYGTTRLTRALLEHGLIDEFQFSVLPVRVGAGRHLFADLDGPAPPLTLTGTRALRSGMVVLTYSAGTTSAGASSAGASSGGPTGQASVRRR